MYNLCNHHSNQDTKRYRTGQSLQRNWLMLLFLESRSLPHINLYPVVSTNVLSISTILPLRMLYKCSYILCNVFKLNLKVFWDNYGFTCSCKKWYRVPIHSLPSFTSDNILQNCNTISQSGFWHWYSPDTQYFRHHKEPSCCPFIVNHFPVSSTTLLSTNGTTNLFFISIIL